MSASTSSPSLSVVLPVHNGAPYLSAAVESILVQTYSDFELLVIDDGSDDESGLIAEAYASRDPRVRVFRQENRGLVATLNRGLALCRAPLVARMDADDVSLPCRFAVQVPRFRDRPRLAVVGGFVKLIDSEGRFLRLGAYPRGDAALAALIRSNSYLEDGSPFAHPAVILRKSAVYAVGGYRTVMAQAQDYDLWLRLAEAGFDMENVPEPVLEYRQHETNVSRRHRHHQVLATLLAQLAHRARLAGLPDPLDGLAQIDDASINLFPPDLRKDIDAQFFVLKHNAISLASADAISDALACYATLPFETRRRPEMAIFLLRAGRGLWAQRRYLDAATCLASAFERDPSLSLRLISTKFTRLASVAGGT